MHLFKVVFAGLVFLAAGVMLLTLLSRSRDPFDQDR